MHKKWHFLVHVVGLMHKILNAKTLSRGDVEREAVKKLEFRGFR